MSFRSSTSSSRRALALGALTCALAWGAVEVAPLPRTAFYGGRKLAQKFVCLDELERSGPLEVLVIGPSYVDQGFDAGRFGAVADVRAINLGVPGTDMYFQSLLLRDVLLQGRLRENPPKAVLWGLRDEVLTRSNINRQYLDSAALRCATGPGGPWALRAAQYLPQFQRRRLLDWVRELSSSFRRLEWESATDARRAELRSWMEPLDAFGRTQLSALTRQEPQSAREREDGNDEDGPARGDTGFLGQNYSTDLDTARAHVRETLRRLHARGIAVWFFFTPYYESVLERSSKHAEQVLTGQFQEYHDWLNGLAAEFGATLVDLRYCAEISGEQRFFYDSRHLNTPGSEPLGALMGELYSGKRALPEAWQGPLPRAQVQHMLGRVERERVPELALGTAHGLDATLGVRRNGLLLDAYASLRIESAGRYRVTLSASEPTVSPALYVRLGGRHYTRWNPPAEPQRSAVVLQARLEAGEYLLELHSQTPRQALGWERLLVEPLGP